MCGITGVWDFKNKVDATRLKKMRELLQHRGPDDKGMFVDRNIGLAHRRLSIIDLSKTAKQPVSNEDESIFIIYNGEIYNFKEIREELEQKGHRFKTNSDTEVIIHAYEEYGDKCLSLLNGMFASAIWDSNKKSLFLARDRLGIKPLYYYWDKKKFIFASEMKAILEYGVSREVDKQAATEYFSYLNVPAPKTIFKNIYKLMPSHYLVIDKKGIRIKQYWDLDYSERKIGKKDAEKLLIKSLKESIRKRLISDVPIGAFLSGGTDSSAVVALMSKVTDNVKTFSMGFEGYENNELDIARKTARMHNTEHNEYTIKPAEFEIFPELVYYADEPFADDSLIPTYMVSKIARKKVTVCLSGDGGDENFAGYERYAKNKIESYYAALPLSIRKIIHGLSINERMKRITKVGMITNDIQRFIKGNEKLLDNEKQQMFDFKFEENNKLKLLRNKNIKNNINKMLYLDVKTTLPNLFLKKVDTASMINSLEVRVPFLDHHFMEFTATLPTNYKLHGLTKKYILKKAIRNIVPKETLGKKKGFSAPVNNWLRSELKEQLKEIILSTTKRGHLNEAYINKLWNQHQKRTFNHQQRLWSLVSFELWNRIYVDEIKYSKILG